MISILPPHRDFSRITKISNPPWLHNSSDKKPNFVRQLAIHNGRVVKRNHIQYDERTHGVDLMEDEIAND